MFVQTHFQRPRHQAASSAPNSALATQAHLHHHHNHLHHRQSTWSGGASHANNSQHNSKQAERRNSLRKARLSSTSSSVNSRDLLLIQTTTSTTTSCASSKTTGKLQNSKQTNHGGGDAHSRPSPKQPSKSLTNSISVEREVRLVANGEKNNHLQVNRCPEEVKGRSKSLCSLTELKQANSKSPKSQDARGEVHLRPPKEPTTEEAQTNDDDDQERRHLLWRKLILNCSIKLTHLLSGKLFAQPPQPATTTDGQSNQSTALSGWRRARFELISSFCMNFITYQLETWRLLVDGATSAHYNQQTVLAANKQVRRQSSLNLPGDWTESSADGHMAHMSANHFNFNAYQCCEYPDGPKATCLAPNHQAARLVHSQPVPSHLLNLPHQLHSPLQLRHTVDGSPLSRSHHQVTPATTASTTYNEHPGHLTVPGVRSLAVSSHHGQTLSSPTLPDEVREAEWRAHQAHLQHQHHPNEHHHHHYHHHHHLRSARAGNHNGNQVRSTRQTTVTKQQQMLARTHTEDLGGVGRRRLAQDYGILVDYGPPGGLKSQAASTNKASSLRTNTGNSYHYFHDESPAKTKTTLIESHRHKRDLNSGRDMKAYLTTNKWPTMDGRTSQTGSVASSVAGSVKSAHSRLTNGSGRAKADSERATAGSVQGSSGKSPSRNTHSSLTKVSLAGAKRRLGFKLRGGLNSLNVHRSEEVLPADVVKNHHLQYHQSYSINRFSKGFGSSAATTTTTTTVNSFNISSDDTNSLGQPNKNNSYKQWLSVNWPQQQQQQQQPNGHQQYDEQAGQQVADPKASFVEGLGAGQIASRQALVSPYLGDIQLSLSDQRGMLEVEVIRVRQLQAKPRAKRLPCK